MPKFRVTRQRQAGISTAIEQRVVEIAEGHPLPMGAVPVDVSIALSDWQSASAAPDNDPEGEN